MAEIVNVTPEVQTTDDPKYVADMVAKAEAGTGNPVPTEQAAEAPAGEAEKLLAGKYKTPEELEKGVLELLKQRKGGDLEGFYKELERGDAGEAKADASPAKEDAPADGAGDAAKTETKTEDGQNQEAAKEALEGTGLNLSDFEAEFATNGKLSDTSYDALAKAGIPRANVDAYIEGMAAKAELAKQAIYTSVGGEQSYTNMIAWASTNLTEGEKAAYNEAINTANPEKYMLALNGLKARYEGAVGKEPALVTGKAAGTTDGTFGSWKEVSLAMQDPRYGKDPAYRREVETKLQASKL